MRVENVGEASPRLVLVPAGRSGQSTRSEWTHDGTACSLTHDCKGASLKEQRIEAFGPARGQLGEANLGFL